MLSRWEGSQIDSVEPGGVDAVGPQEPRSTPDGVVGYDLDEIVERAAPALRHLAGRTVLVAGAAGFLPSYIVDALAHANRTLLDQPCRILCVDNLATGTPERLAHLVDDPHTAVMHQDLARECAVDEPVEYVLHGASIASPTWYRRYPLETIDVNVTGTRRLLDLAVSHHARSFLYLSSSEVYGDPPPEHIPTSEEYPGNVSCIGPRACYDESKRLAETLCTTYQRQQGLRTVLARPFNVYGPRLRLDDGRVIPDFLGDAVAGRPITLYSDGQATRSFCYLTDAVTALLLLLADDEAVGPYNVGNDEERTIAEVAKTVDALRGAAHGVAFASNADPDYLIDNPSRRCPDLSRLTSRTAYKPRVSLRTGLERTLRYYLKEEHP